MKRQTGAGTIAAMALTCVFGATLLSSLTVGAGIYRRVEQRSEACQNARVGLTYITAKIHSCDSEGAVRTGRFGDSDAVFLRQDMDGESYETILYVYDGWLMELLREADWELYPEDGQEITEASAMTVAQPGENLLCIGFTDGAGASDTAYITLRSGTGAAVREAPASGGAVVPDGIET